MDEALTIHENLETIEKVMKLIFLHDLRFTLKYRFSSGVVRNSN